MRLREWATKPGKRLLARTNPVARLAKTTHGRIAKPSVHSAELIDQATVRSIRVSKPRVDQPSRIFNPIRNFIVSFKNSPLFLLVERKFGTGSLALPPWRVLQR
jgi:hypothetical protein